MDMVVLFIVLLCFVINPERTVSVIGQLLGLGLLLIFGIPVVVGLFTVAAFGAITLVELVGSLVT